MHKTLRILLLALCALSVPAYAADYAAADSIRIEKMLVEAAEMPRGTNGMMYFAEQFIGTPYAAHTLDMHDEERLAVNTRQLDCTTFVETVAALSMCAENGEKRFSDFCNRLRHIRYIDGIVDYCMRKHYFTLWIEENVKNGMFSIVDGIEKGMTRRKTLNIDYMTAHSGSYRMLRNNSTRIERIAEMERRLTGKSVEYIPKECLADSKRLKRHIADGDIIVIMTSIKGLDTSHVGIACWKNGALCMLHASSRHKKVLAEPEPLYQYMMKQPRQTGIMAIARNKAKGGE